MQFKPLCSCAPPDIVCIGDPRFFSSATVAWSRSPAWSLRVITPFCACLIFCSKCLPNVARRPVSLPLNPNRAVAPPQPLAAAKDQENAAKETKLGSDVTWEWQNEDGDWKAFSSAHANQLAGEFEKGAESTTLSLSRTQKYEVNFKQMHQANKSTGWKRSVRCKTSKSSWCKKKQKPEL